MRFFNTHIGRCATLLALGGGIALYSQGTQTASMTITVVDPSGAAVSGARVRLTSPSLMAERTGASNAQGLFFARLLPPGNYTIEIMKDGFQTVRTQRQVGMDQHFQPRIVMQTVAGATVVIDSTASSDIDPTSVQSSSNYDAKRVDTLPIGRNSAGLLAITPGVTSGPNGQQIRGGLGVGNLFLIDGQNVNDNAFNNQGITLINDAIEEIQIIRGAISAEYGNVDGGVINTLTKSGGNTFSGMIRADLTNPTWNAVTPATNRDGIANRITRIMVYELGGYFVKDLLWFHATMQDYGKRKGISVLDPDLPSFINVDDPEHPFLDGGNTPFNWSEVNKNYQAKVTYLINQDHNVSFAYNFRNNHLDKRNQTGQGEYPGELKALGVYDYRSWMYNVSWRAIWSPTFNTEIRYGSKSQRFGSGALNTSTDMSNSQVFGEDFDGLYNNGYFDMTAFPEYRVNTTANLKASYFLNWNGTHEIDFGVDYYDGYDQSKNGQSATEWSFWVWDYSPTARTAIPSEAVWWKGVRAKAGQKSYGLYVNDKWKMDQHWSFQVGFRFDTYKAYATDVTEKMASASGISPRLGVTYDILGDQKYIIKASYCLYNGAVLEGITGAVSNAGSPNIYVYVANWLFDGEYYGGPNEHPLHSYNPANEGYGWDNPPYDNPDMYVGHDQLFNMNPNDPNCLYEMNYPIQATDRGFSVGVDNGLKAPTIAEIQLGFAYSFKSNDFGNGYASLTYVQKDWKNMIAQTLGPHGRVYSEAEDVWAWINWYHNEPRSKRKYTSLEFEMDYIYQKWHVNGNITWSQLKGNFQGEISGSPSAGGGETLNYYTNDLMNGMVLADGTVLPDSMEQYYDYNISNPYGYISGHRPTVANFFADYTIENAYGKTVLGFGYSLTHGASYGRGRSVPLGYELYRYEYTNAAGANVVTNRPPNVPLTTRTQYAYGKRTIGKYPTMVYHDLTITHDFNIFKVLDTDVSAFVKMTMYNFFNHQQIGPFSWGSYQTLGVTYGGVDPAGGPSSLYPTEASWANFHNTDPTSASWTQTAAQAALNGARNTTSNWGTPRQIAISMGVRF
jgi:outer membrane receptor for ferrienterochelin and colicin